MAVLCCQTATVDAAPQVKTDKDIYRAGETIRVNFFNSPGNNRDWICIVAAGSPDTDAGDYKYMPSRVSEGVLTFDVPPPGKYEVRAYYNYSRNGYVISARYSFTVTDMESPAKPASTAETIKSASPPLTDFSAGTPHTNVSVFHFTPLSMDVTNYGITVTNTLINALKMQSSFVMLGRKDLEILMVNNNLQQNDQTDNMIEIGALLGLNFVIAGSIEKRGTMIITNYKVVSIAKKNVIFTNKFISMGEADLISNVKKMSDSIVESIQRSTK
jgi:TolB-like protein